MALFAPKENCPACGNVLDFRIYKTANEKPVCTSCVEKCGFNTKTFQNRATAILSLKEMTLDQIRGIINQAEVKKQNNDISLASFVPTKKIGSYLYLDEPNETWLVPDDLFGKIKAANVHSFSDIIGYELLLDDSSVISGGVGRAVVGAAIFGGVGAIVGGITGKKKGKTICESLRLKIIVNDLSSPTQYIDFITSKTKTESTAYKVAYQSAQECISALQIICDKKKPANSGEQANTSNADEIMKYKQLLDAGAITLEEYDLIKQKLLGI